MDTEVDVLEMVTEPEQAAYALRVAINSSMTVAAKLEKNTVVTIMILLSSLVRDLKS